MKLKHYELDSFCNLAFNIKIYNGKESRMRTRLLKLISKYMEESLTPEKDEIIQKFGDRDENGALVLTEDKQGVKLKESTIPEFNVEFDLLMNEDFIIEENETNQEMLVVFGNSLLNCSVELSGQDAILYDDWCEKFEEVIARYAEKEES